MPNGNINVMLVDDHAIVRQGLRSILEREPDLRVVAEASTVAETLAVVVRARPDVVLLDLKLSTSSDTEGLDLCEQLEVKWICVTAGSPYYNPHIQRPAIFPPSDGYLPPEDPLAGVARQIDATARLKARHPGMAIIGSAYSYLQEWLPHVAQHVVGAGMADMVGLGRLVLSYPDLPADVLSGRPLKSKLLCRTFSDCTTGPRLGLISGCYPLDPDYKAMPQAAQVLSVRTSLTSLPIDGSKTRVSVCEPH